VKGEPVGTTFKIISEREGGRAERRTKRDRMMCSRQHGAALKACRRTGRWEVGGERDFSASERGGRTAKVCWQPRRGERLLTYSLVVFP